MARKLHRKRPFRAHAGFTRMDVKSRILRVLRHQKEEPIGIRVLEIQAQIKREEHAAFLETLQQMEESGEIWRRKNSVVLSNSQGLVQAQRLFRSMKNSGLPDRNQRRARRLSPTARRTSFCRDALCREPCPEIWCW